MRLGRVLTLGFVIAIAQGAFAAEGFYIVKQRDSQVCTVVNEKPTDGNTVVVDEVVYTTELEAKDAIAKLETCKTG
jgi:hypothetical protein